MLVADDEPLVARVTSRVIGTFCTTLPPVFSLDDLEEALATQVPDVVILDVRFQNDVSSLDHLPRLATSCPGVRWILHTGRPERAPVGRAFSLGVRGYLVKPSDPGEAAIAIGLALRGCGYLSTSRLVRDTTRVLALSEPLTPAQLNVFAGLRQGFAYSKIALRLGISESTVGKHVHLIRLRLGIATEGSYVRWQQIVCPGLDGVDC
ncbi:MAG: response regulator transcription factor [Gemmatimonadota bacterium]